jgi:pyruvate formate lyase activating enzyme
MKIAGIQKTTLIDYPGEVASTIFVRGCNFNCGFCYNKALISVLDNAGDIEEASCIEFLVSRYAKIKHVVITGGEPTLSRGLQEFIKKLKDLGFQIKLDTNGGRPHVLRELIESRLLDYVAMDIKSAPKKYREVTGSNVGLGDIRTSIDLLCASDTRHEFRTTVWKEGFQDHDFVEMFEWVKGSVKLLYLQNFHNTTDNAGFTAFSATDGKRIVDIGRPYEIEILLRGNWK